MLTLGARNLVCRATLATSGLRMSICGAAGVVNPLLSPPEAFQLSSTGKCVFVDASYHMNSPRNPFDEYLNIRLPNARFFPIDEIADKSNPLPHMLPSETEFEQAMDEMGISNDDHVVVYTADGCVSGPRVWYTFKAFGHEKVSYLNGGLPSWSKGFKIPTEGPTSAAPTFNKAAGGGYKATFNRKMVASKDDVTQAMESGIAQIADARSFGRYVFCYTRVLPSFLVCDVSTCLSPIHLLLAFSDTTWHESNHHSRPSIINRHNTTHITYYLTGAGTCSPWLERRA